MVWTTSRTQLPNQGGESASVPSFNEAINQFGLASSSIYSAGQVSVRRRGRGGTFYRLNYSYSKSIDDASQLNGTSAAGLVAAAQDINNRRLDRGRPDWDRGHVVTAALSWQLPIGRGQSRTCRPD